MAGGLYFTMGVTTPVRRGASAMQYMRTQKITSQEVCHLPNNYLLTLCNITGELGLTMVFNRTTARRGATNVVTQNSVAPPSTNVQSGGGASNSTQVMPDYGLHCPDKLSHYCDALVAGI